MMKPVILLKKIRLMVQRELDLISFVKWVDDIKLLPFPVTAAEVEMTMTQAFEGYTRQKCGP
jgi:hypothetical protein